MDRRYEAYRRLVPTPVPEPIPNANLSSIAQLLTEGQHSEFWVHVKQEIDQQIRVAEGRFLDTLAKDYETYVAWWSRRQALIAVLAIPQTPPTKES